MTFDEWLDEPMANGEPRYKQIYEFAGPTKYPHIEYLLKAAWEEAFNEGYGCGSNNMIGQG